MATNLLGRLFLDNEEWDGEYPWDKDGALRHNLEDAGWRYAILIGITDPEREDFPERVRAADRKNYGHFVEKTTDGRAIWNCKQATAFVAELSGASMEISAAWLDYDWDNGGEV